MILTHKLILILLSGLLTLPSCLLAESRLSLTYEMTYRRFQEDKVPRKDFCVLDIADTQSHFYSRDGEYRYDIEDSLSQKGYNAYEVHDVIVKMGLSRNFFYCNVFKNYPVRGQLTYTMFLLDEFRYDEAMPEFAWTLLDRDTVIAGHTCYAARTEYRGRTWTAYYTTDIPVSDGPWKLCGLPGLILYARDSTGNFVFDCIKIAEGNRRPMVIRNLKYRKCDVNSKCKLQEIKAKGDLVLEEYLWGIKAKRFDKYGHETIEKPRRAVLIEYPVKK